MKKKIISISVCIALIYLLSCLDGYSLKQSLEITFVIMTAIGTIIFVGLTGIGVRHKDDGIEDYPNW